MNKETLLENFELLSDTPNGIQKLRELILQLAIQGKLVPQYPNDEPAMILINNIKAEKNRLAKEKKIKINTLPQIQTEEMPYNLPNEWNWIRLGDLGQTQTGTTPSKNNPEFFGKDYPFLKPGDISNNFVNYNNDGLSQLGMKNGRFIKADSILMVCIGGSIGKVNCVDRDCSCNQQINVLTPYLDLDSRLFSYFMRSRYFQNEVKSRAPQTTLPILSKGKWELILLPLPPYEELNRILSKINQLMALCDELEARQQKKYEQRIILNNAVLDKFLTAPTPEEFVQHWQRISDNFDLLYDAPETVRQLRKAVLQLAVQGKLVAQDEGDEPASVLLEKIIAEKEQLIREKKIKKTKENGEILKDEYITPFPKNWILSKIVDLGFVTKLAGFEYTKYVRLEDCGEVPVIRAQNVRMNYINESKLKYIDMDTSNLLDRCALTKKAILMTFIGAGIGDVAIFNKNERWHLAPNVAKIEPFNQYEEKIDIKYLLYYLMSNTGRDEIFKFRKATAQPSLSMGTIRQVIVALPPLKEQKRIVAKVDQLMALCDELETGLVQAQTEGGKLMEAVVHHVLAG